MIDPDDTVRIGLPILNMSDYEFSVRWPWSQGVHGPTTCLIFTYPGYLPKNLNRKVGSPSPAEPAFRYGDSSTRNTVVLQQCKEGKVIGGYGGLFALSSLEVSGPKSQTISSDSHTNPLQRRRGGLTKLGNVLYTRSKYAPYQLLL